MTRTTRRSARIAAATDPPSSSASTTNDEPEEEEMDYTWSQDNKAPGLILPESSSDLLIASEVMFDAGEIYETCVTYYRSIQISPFLFEDFCCALRSPEQTRLLAEIHIAFIRLFFRDDEDNQTSFCSQDTNNCYNIMLQLLDGMTYAEILRHYLESDSRFQCADILAILSENYPFVEVEKRIKVLKWLCDFFLQTSVFKQLISNDGQMVYDDVCRDCGKPGDVLLCDGCESCYHTECVSLEEIPEGQWFCQVCQAHVSRDAIDLVTLAQSMAKHKYRISPLGYDRQGRIYWFFARRIFVQELSTNSIYYYSTLPQLYELVRQLDSSNWEKHLCANISESLNEIVRQMNLTLDLTRNHREALIQKINGSRETPLAYLDFDNSFRMANILGENFAENVKMETDSGGPESLLSQIREHLHIVNGRLKDTFWSGGFNEQQLTELQNSIIESAKIQNGGETGFLKSKMESLRRGYRLAFGDGRYREYQNEYSTNELAKPFKQRSKERDKKKYLSARFALTDEGEFTWAVPKNNDVYVKNSDVCSIIQMSMKRLIERIPDELFHRLWKEEKLPFLEKLMDSKSAVEISYLLLQLERAIRKPVFSNIWWNSLGFTKLMRNTSDDREERSKTEAIRKKDERALQTADYNDPDVAFVKYLETRPSSFTLWRLKDEAFRLNNWDDMGGWLWISSTLVRNFQQPTRPPAYIDYLIPTNNVSTPAVNKVLKLQFLVKKLAVWRDYAEKRIGGMHGHLTCYSPVCVYNPLGFNPTNTVRCYNPNCPRIVCELDTSKKSRAIKGGIKIEPVRRLGDSNRPMQLRKNVRGEGIPFPFPKPFTYLARKSKKRSLLIIPQAILRRIARQGGTNPNQYLPGFNKTAKANSTVWPYPCPRPIFDNCWRFVTLNSTTFHAIALSFRIMYSCIRWADMEPHDKNESRVISHFADHDERRSIISHKEYPPDGYYERYKLKVHILSIDDDNDDDISVSYRNPTRTQPRVRKRKAPIRSRASLPNSADRIATTTKEQWMDGVDLQLYEIVNYWIRFNRAVANVAPVQRQIRRLF